MKTYVFSNDFILSSELKDFITDKVKKTYSRFELIINKIEVRLSDENGPKGGEDKSCTIQICTNNFQDIVIKDTEADVYAAVSRCIARAKRTLARRLKHSQTFGKKRLSVELADYNTLEAS